MSEVKWRGLQLFDVTALSSWKVFEDFGKVLIVTALLKELLKLSVYSGIPQCIPGPLLQTWLTLIPAWISNHMLSKVWEEITHAFPNVNGCTIEVWEWDK